MILYESVWHAISLPLALGQWFEISYLFCQRRAGECGQRASERVGYVVASILIVQLLADAVFEPVIDDEYDLFETDQAFMDMQTRISSASSLYIHNVQ